MRAMVGKDKSGRFLRIAYQATCRAKAKGAGFALLFSCDAVKSNSRAVAIRKLFAGCRLGWRMCGGSYHLGSMALALSCKTVAGCHDVADSDFAAKVALDV